MTTNKTTMPEIPIIEKPVYSDKIIQEKPKPLKVFLSKDGLTLLKDVMSGIIYVLNNNSLQRLN